MRKMGLADTIIALARLCSTKVIVPEEVGCCGFAGDRGFTYPELNAYALRKLRPQIEAAGIGIGYMHSEYEEYLPIDGHYVYQQTSRMNYFGPLKLKFALVWRLWNTDGKKGGVR